MRKKWGRFRGYVDELEEDMRAAGEHLAEVEAIVAETWERDTWRSGLRSKAAAEIVRRGLDVPFFGDLIRAAWRVGPDLDREPPDFEGSAWEEDSRVQRHGPASRVGRIDDAPSAPSGEPASANEPPARLRAAERALAERTRSIAVALDDLVSPRNASAVLRTADALGLQEVHVVQPVGQPKIERTVTMRAERWLDLTWYRDPMAFVEAMRSRGRRILVADFGPDAVSIDEVPLFDRVAIVLGSEQRGVSDALRDAADAHFYLPTVGFTSYLNVSVAAAISCWTIDRRMRAAGLRRPLEPDDLRTLRRSWYEQLSRGNPALTARHRAFLDDPPTPAPAVPAKHARTSNEDE